MDAIEADHDPPSQTTIDQRVEIIHELACEWKFGTDPFKSPKLEIYRDREASQRLRAEMQTQVNPTEKGKIEVAVAFIRHVEGKLPTYKIPDSGVFWNCWKSGWYVPIPHIPGYTSQFHARGTTTHGNSTSVMRLPRSGNIPQTLMPFPKREGDDLFLYELHPLLSLLWFRPVLPEFER
jgi:hypothetical protein